MPRWSLYIVIVLLLAGATALVLEARHLAERLGEAELVASAAEQRAVRAEQLVQPDQAPSQPEGPQAQAPQPEDPQPEDSQPAAEPADADEASPAVSLTDYTRLQAELHTARQRLDALTELLEQRNAELERRVEAAAEAARNSLKPMPEGVRHCLKALHDCLREEGYTDQRFLRAMKLDKEGLHEVEVLDASKDRLSVSFVTAARMTATLDRAAGRLELRFFEGHRAVDGERAALPDDGFVLRFDEVDGRLFERRLPFLVRGEGAYPAAVASPEAPKTDLDPGTRRQWLSRMNSLLAKARTQRNWRVSQVRGLDDGFFREIELIGTDDKSLVVASAHCERLAFELNEKSGVVSLLLNDGVLRQSGVQSTITGEGYRMLLPGVTPKETIDAMLGMIVRK